MNIKRTSYFTFLVAITTLATVTSCSKVNGQPQNNKAIAEEILLDSNQLFNICLEGLGGTDSQFELARAFKDKTLKAGKFKLAIDPSGTLSVYLVIDKDYKGPVSAKIFGDNQADYGSLAVLTKDESTNSSFTAQHFDKRAGIAIRNRILRE